MGVLQAVCLLALNLSGLPADARSWKAALEALSQAERARDLEGFALRAADLLADDSARAVREVCDAHARLLSGRPPLTPADHFTLHSRLAKALSQVKSAPGQKELLRQREKASAWQVRALCLDASSFEPKALELHRGALEALHDRTPAVTRRALHYLKNDRRLVTLDAVLARYLEVDLPKGPKGDDWNRLRLAFRAAMVSLVKVRLPAAVDYQGYVQERRNDLETLFEKPPPTRGATQLTIFGAEVTGNNIAFVIDVSGSMMATDPVPLVVEPGKTMASDKAKAAHLAMVEDRRRMSRARKELSKVVEGLPDGKRFNIIAYSSDVVPWKRVLARVAPETRQEALAFIAGLKADGLTATDDALETAFADLAVDTVYLITDGAPTHRGTAGSELPPDAPEIIEKIHSRMGELNYFRGVRIHTLGFPEAEEKFLKKLAADHGGEYTPIR